MNWEQKEQAYTWQALSGHIAPAVLVAPRTGADPLGAWPAVHPRVIGYLMRNVLGTCWADHLALMGAVLAAQRRDVATVEQTLKMLHPRFCELFPHFQLTNVGHWRIEQHLVPYVRGEIFAHDSLATRLAFFKSYTSGTNLVARWFECLLPIEQEQYRPFLLPPIHPFLAQEFVPLIRAWKQDQRAHRKQETEAIVPHFTQLRAEAHWRFNRLSRLRQAYQQAQRQVLADHSNLPLQFGYEEGEPPVERIVCRLWDRRSFVLHPEHAAHYDPYTRSKHRHPREEHEEVFLELVRAQPLEGTGPAEGLWFTELLKREVLSSKVRKGTPQEVATKQAWLRAWGYGEEQSSGLLTPFDPRHKGLLCWPAAPSAETGPGTGRFIAEAGQRTQKILIPVESLYAAATFGLLALELLTTTGMRINELMQVSLLPECLIRLVDDPPPGALDSTPRIRYVLRLLPKGERTTTRHHYGIGKDALRLLTHTAQMLCTHYRLARGEPLPRVAFSWTSTRRHRFEAERVPYIFQYEYEHLSEQAISACLRFLLHGMVFQTSTGEPVVLTAHLLRHAFATFAVQVEGLPIDLVASWLKQKNLDTTRYYSQKGQQEVAQEHAAFVERLATEINLREAILRSPEEIRQLAEQARLRVGTLVPVCGGECSFDGWCHNQFECIRCPSKVPDPDKRSQVEEKQRWAQQRLAYYVGEGLVLEAEKMRHLLRNCALELREMEMMVAYRKDEGRVAQVTFFPRSNRQPKE